MNPWMTNRNTLISAGILETPVRKNNCVFPQDLDVFIAVQNLVTSFESPDFYFIWIRVVDLHRIVFLEAVPLNLGDKSLQMQVVILSYKCLRPSFGAASPNRALCNDWNALDLHYAVQ